MNSLKAGCPLVLAFLSIAIATGESLSGAPTHVHDDPPFWQFVLREFIFKTISGPSNDDSLYQKLLDAPFYGSSLLYAVEGKGSLMSRGDVYHMTDGGWILCEEGCINCDLCELSREPEVKWILKRVIRPTSRSTSPKWDLQLTVFPRLRTGKEQSFDYAHMRSQDELGRETILRNSGPATTPDPARSNWLNEEIHSSGESRISGTDYPESSPVSGRRLTKRTRIKRYRVKPSVGPEPLWFYQPQDDVAGRRRSTERSDESTPRLIMGIDQHGEKHLVHVVPVGLPTVDQDSTSYRNSYQTDNTARIGRTALQERSGLSYEKLIDRIMNSLNSHRGFIEKFIFSDRLEPDYNDGPIHPSYAFSDPQRASDDDRFDGRNFDDYRVGASAGVNQYPTDFRYQMHERDDQIKGRHPDTESDVNKPSGGYQDQTIEYEPYVTSADGRQDERSPAWMDGERRRRNLVPKVVTLTDDPQGLSQNHTEIHTPDPKFPMNRQLTGNSTDRKLTDKRLEINESRAGSDNLSGERSNEKTPTAGESWQTPASAG